MDILYSLRYGKPILFHRDKIPEVLKTLNSQDLTFSPNITSKNHTQASINPYLQTILIDIMSLTSLFNNQNSNPPTQQKQTLDITTFLEILTSICSRLLHFQPLIFQPLQSRSKSRAPKPKPDNENKFTFKFKREEAYHIGLITFMTTLFLQWDHRRVNEYELISRRLRKVLDQDEDDTDLDLELRLWLLFIASLWFGGTDCGWIRERIRVCSARLGIKCWEGVRRLFCGRFPWIEALHGECGRGVWDFVAMGRGGGGKG